MKKNPGYIVETKEGKEGYTIHSDHAVNGKVIVYLTFDHLPLLDENGKHQKLLCNRNDLKIIGFKD